MEPDINEILISPDTKKMTKPDETTAIAWNAKLSGVFSLPCQSYLKQRRC